MKKCPYCAELIQDEAIICRFCNRDLPAAVGATSSADVKWEDFVQKYRQMTSLQKIEAWDRLTGNQRRYLEENFDIERSHEKVVRQPVQASETPIKRPPIRKALGCLSLVIFVFLCFLGLVMLALVDLAIVLEKLMETWDALTELFIELLRFIANLFRYILRHTHPTP